MFCWMDMYCFHLYNKRISYLILSYLILVSYIRFWGSSQPSWIYRDAKCYGSGVAATEMTPLLRCYGSDLKCYGFQQKWQVPSKYQSSSTQRVIYIAVLTIFLQKQLFLIEERHSRRPEPAYICLLHGWVAMVTNEIGLEGSWRFFCTAASDGDVWQSSYCHLVQQILVRLGQLISNDIHPNAATTGIANWEWWAFFHYLFS